MRTDSYDGSGVTQNGDVYTRKTHDEPISKKWTNERLAIGMKAVRSINSNETLIENIIHCATLDGDAELAIKATAVRDVLSEIQHEN